jgi:hypothetical protein
MDQLHGKEKATTLIVWRDLTLIFLEFGASVDGLITILTTNIVNFRNVKGAAMH